MRVLPMAICCGKAQNVAIWRRFPPMPEMPRAAGAGAANGRDEGTLEEVPRCQIWHERNRTAHDNPMANNLMVSAGAAKNLKVLDRMSAGGAKMHRPCRGPAASTVRRWRRACRGEQQGRRCSGRPCLNCLMSLRSSGREATAIPSLPVSDFGPRKIPARRSPPAR